MAVTVNGVEFGASSSTFTYAATNATYELRPRRLATKGGTIVQVRGPHLELAPSLAARFGVHEGSSHLYTRAPWLVERLLYKSGPWPSA